MRKRMKTVLALTLAGVLGIMQPLAVYAASPDAAGGSTVVENTVTENTGTAAESTETEDTDTAAGVTATGNTDTAAEDTVSQDEVSGNFAGAQDFEEAIEDGETEEGVVSDEASNFDFGFGFQMMYFNQFAGEATTLITGFLDFLTEGNESATEFMSVIEFFLFGKTPGQSSMTPQILETLANIQEICENILTEVKSLEAQTKANDTKIEAMIAGQNVSSTWTEMNDRWQSDVIAPQDNIAGLSAAIGDYKEMSQAAVDYKQAWEDNGANDAANEVSAVKTAKTKYDSAKESYDKKLLAMYLNLDDNARSLSTEEQFKKMLTTDTLNSRLIQCLDEMTRNICHTTKGSRTYIDAAAQYADAGLSFNYEQYVVVQNAFSKQIYQIMMVELVYEDLISKQSDYVSENGDSATKEKLEKWVEDFGERAGNFGTAASAIISGYNYKTTQDEYIYYSASSPNSRLKYSQYMRPADVYKTSSDGKSVTDELVVTTMQGKSHKDSFGFVSNGGGADNAGRYYNGDSDYLKYEPYASDSYLSEIPKRTYDPMLVAFGKYVLQSKGYAGSAYYKEMCPIMWDKNTSVSEKARKIEKIEVEYDGKIYNVDTYFPSAQITTDANYTKDNKLKFKRAAVTADGSPKIFYILDGDTTDASIKNFQSFRQVIMNFNGWRNELNSYSYILPNCDYFNLLYEAFTPSEANGNSFGCQGISDDDSKRSNATNKAKEGLSPLFSTNAFSLKGSVPSSYLSDYLGYAKGQTLYLMLPGASIDAEKDIEDYGYRRLIGDWSITGHIYNAAVAYYPYVNMGSAMPGGLGAASENICSIDAYRDDKNTKIALILYNENDDYKVKISASSSTTAASISVLDSIDSNSSASSINSTGGSVVKLRISPSDTSAEALSGMSLHLKRTFDSFGTTTDEEIISADDIGSLIKTEDKNYYEIPVAVPYVENAEYYLKAESTSTKVQGVRMLRAGSFTASGKTYDVSYNDALLTYTGNDLGSVLKGALTVTDESGQELNVDKVYASDTLGTGDITVQAIRISSSGSESSESSSALLFYDEGAFSDEAEVAEALYADGSSAVNEEVRGADLSGLDISISPREVSSTGAADSDGSIVYAQFLDGKQMVKYNEEQKKLVYLKLQMPDWKEGAKAATEENVKEYKTIKVRKEDIASYSTSENRITVNFTNNLKGSITVAYKGSADGSEEALPDTVPEDGKDSALRLPSVGFNFNDGETYYLLTGQTLPLNKKKVTESEADGVQYKETVTYTYSSDAPKTVAASGTKITAKKAGEAVITRTAKHVLSVKEAGSKKWVASTPIVKEDKVTVHVEKLALKKPASILAGNYGAVRLSGFTSAGQERNYGMACYSSNPNVASVDHSGNITANSAGTAKITVYVKGKKLSTSVKVVNTLKVRKFREPVTLVPFQSVTVKDEDKEFKPSAKTVWQEKQSADEGTDEASSADEGSGSTEDTRQELKELKSKTGKVKAYYNDVVAVTPAGKITAIGTGSCVLVGTDSNGKTIEIDITVPEQNRNVTLAAGASKTLSFYGVTAKKATWQTTPVPVQPADGEATENAVSAVKDGKVTAGAKAGTGVVYCTAKSKAYKDIENLPEVTYETTVLVESPEIVASSASGNEELEFYSNGNGGYSLYLTEDGLGAKIPTTGLYHKVIFKSADTNTAFVDENGVIYPRRDNKDDKTTKVTATIGKKKLTINVTVYGYEHYGVDHDER